MRKLFEYSAGIIMLTLFVFFVEDNNALGMAIILSHIYNAGKIYHLEKKIEKDVT